MQFTKPDELSYRANDPFLVRLRELLRIHDMMFRRLLFEQPSNAVQLADLFRDIGETYIEIAGTLRKNEDEP